MTLKEYWVDFFDHYCPEEMVKGLAPGQAHDLKMAFFSGASAAIAALLDNATPPDVVWEIGKDIQALGDEITKEIKQLVEACPR